MGENWGVIGKLISNSTGVPSTMVIYDSNVSIPPVEATTRYRQ
jgi:hypothetical protein